MSAALAPARRSNSRPAEVALEGHEPTTLDFPNGCEGRFELGPWRIDAQREGGSNPRESEGTQRPRSDGGANTVRFALTGGDPNDAIANIGGLGKGEHLPVCPLKLSAPGVRIIDARQWEFDLQVVDPDYRTALTRGFAVPHTTSGTALWGFRRKAVADSGLTTFEFDAPANLCKMVGHVVDGSGAAVAGACVAGFGIGYERRPTAISGDDGRFEFDNLSCGQCWFFVSDDRWGSRKLSNQQADLSAGSRDDLVIVVDPLRQFELDARHVEFGDARFVVMIIEGLGFSPCHGSRVFARNDLTRVLTMPASWWGSSFAVRLVAVPRDGLQLHGDIERWAHEVSGWRTAPFIPNPWIAGSNARATLTSD
jgi:hypothetical protein